MTSATKICFIRHGETNWNIEKRIQGQSDTLLNENGLIQSQNLAMKVAEYNFSAIYSSDLSRAKETAKILFKRSKLKIKILPQLRERNLGIFQGHTKKELKKVCPRAYRKYLLRDPEYDFENGESMIQFTERVNNIVDTLKRCHKGQSIALVSHAGVFDAIFRRVTQKKLNTRRELVFPNCTFKWFILSEKNERIVSY